MCVLGGVGIHVDQGHVFNSSDLQNAKLPLSKGAFTLCSICFLIFILTNIVICRSINSHRSCALL